MVQSGPVEENPTTRDPQLVQWRARLGLMANIFGIKCLHLLQCMWAVQIVDRSIYRGFTSADITLVIQCKYTALAWVGRDGRLLVGVVGRPGSPWPV